MLTQSTNSRLWTRRSNGSSLKPAKTPSKSFTKWKGSSIYTRPATSSCSWKWGLRFWKWRTKSTTKSLPWNTTLLNRTRTNPNSKFKIWSTWRANSTRSKLATRITLTSIMNSMTCTGKFNSKFKTSTTLELFCLKPISSKSKSAPRLTSSSKLCLTIWKANSSSYKTASIKSSRILKSGWTQFTTQLMKSFHRSITSRIS